MGEAFPLKSDWPQLVGARERRIDQFRRAMRRGARFGLGPFGSRVLGRAWARYSGTLVRDAVELFAKSDHVVTDRLHGHILACLMDKSSTVVDNFYGKNFSYVNAWTAGSALVTLHGH
jgi:pyruvyl transferase EpsO